MTIDKMSMKCIVVYRILICPQCLVPRVLISLQMEETIYGVLFVDLVPDAADRVIITHALADQENCVEGILCRAQ